LAPAALTAIPGAAALALYVPALALYVPALALYVPALALYIDTLMSRVSPLTALDPAFACPAFKASIADAMEGSTPAFRYLKSFTLGFCSGCASPFPSFFSALNPFAFHSYPGHIRFFPAFFGALDPFTFGSYPGHIGRFPSFDGIP
jgi:hypothetical protein